MFSGFFFFFFINGLLYYCKLFFWYLSNFRWNNSWSGSRYLIIESLFLEVLLGFVVVVAFFFIIILCSIYNFLGDLVDMVGVSVFPLNSCMHQSLDSERQGFFFLKQDLQRLLDTILEYFLICLEPYFARWN